MGLVSEVERAKGEWEKAGDYAFGLIKVDGLKPTDDFVEMAKKEIRGELTYLYIPSRRLCRF